MGPPGFVVARPDAAVTVHSDVRRTGEHQEAFVRIDALKCFSGSSRHVEAEQVVYLVVPDHLSVYIVIESPIIILAVFEASQLVAELPYADVLFYFLRLFASVPVARSGICELPRKLFRFYKPFL